MLAQGRTDAGFLHASAMNVGDLVEVEWIGYGVMDGVIELKTDKLFVVRDEHLNKHSRYTTQAVPFGDMKLMQFKARRETLEKYADDAGMTHATRAQTAGAAREVSDIFEARLRWQNV